MCEVPTAGEADNCAIDTTCRAADGGDSTCVRDGCGNGFVEELEGCDDGNLVDADGCSSTCFDEALCGNDVLNTGEECDEMASDCVGCTVQALDVSAGGVFNGSFGDGSFDRFLFTLTEETTVQIDTNDVGGDCVLIDTVMYLGRFEDEGIEFVASNDDRSFGQYCSTIVETLPAGTYEIYINNYFGGGIGAYELSVRFLGGCGDSIIDEPLGETCDDGNTDAGDGWSAECRTEAVCGDGAIQEGETCDDEAVDCIQCQTIASQMATVGAYVGGMQTGGFDLFDLTSIRQKLLG